MPLLSQNDLLDMSKIIFFPLGTESGPYQSHLLVQTLPSVLESVIILIGAKHMQLGWVQHR